jgi:hypothetical protein
MTVHAVFSNTSGMSILVFADGFIFFVVVTPATTHGKGLSRIGFVCIITMMTGVTGQVIAIAGCMRNVIENHKATVCIKFHFLGFWFFYKHFCVMTKITFYRIFYMTACTLFTDAPFMDVFIFTGFVKFFTFIVMAIPAAHGAAG